MQAAIKAGTASPEIPSSQTTLVSIDGDLQFTAKSDKLAYEKTDSRGYDLS